MDRILFCIRSKFGGRFGEPSRPLFSYCDRNGGDGEGFKGNQKEQQGGS